MNVLHGVVYTKLAKITFSRFLSLLLGLPGCFLDYVVRQIILVPWLQCFTISFIAPLSFQEA